MHLHHDKESFKELIIGAANELHVSANIIEKDYFVTLTLKELSTKLKDMVFKGERTLVDKVFAICDYYLDGKTDKHSRHLYDIHKIYTNMEIPADFCDLIASVRSLRSELSVCPSTKDGVDANQVLQEIVEAEAYRNDYEEITSSLLFTPLAYEEAITSIVNIINLRVF